MQALLRQALRVARLDRRAYTELIFDEYATGNAVLLVSGIVILNTLGRLVFAGVGGVDLATALIAVALSTMWRWMIATGILWLVATKLFDGEGRFQTALRMTGYAYVPFVLLTFAPLAVFDAPIIGSWIDLVAVVWFAAGLWTIAQVLFDLRANDAIAAAILSAVGWLLASLIF